MMLDIMNRCRERFVFSDSSLLEELELEDTLAERMSRIGIFIDIGKNGVFQIQLTNICS